MSIQFLSWDGFVLNVRTRFPFRHGIATLTACPHLIVRAKIAIDGQTCTGYAADHLPPKWFTKNPETAYRDDVAEMIDVIRHAGKFAAEIPAAPNFFAFWEQLYQRQGQWAVSRQIPLLLGHFGTSFMERAAIDAFCRLKARPFGDLLREGQFGMSLELPSAPLKQVICRHTVGLADPITASDIAAADRVKDGLPQALDECIDAYGLTHFKVKLSGDVSTDATRLHRLAEVISSKVNDYAFTLDGNENFKAVEPLRRLWDSLTNDASLQPFLKRLIFVEQPLHRDIALDDSVRSAMREWRDHPPMIIDESDATIESLPRALECGYQGVSHKNCKGVFKGLLNAKRIAAAKKSNPQGGYILSGEDLSNIAPISLQQDLAVMASLGIPHVERNGQHYFKGISYLPETEQRRLLKLHDDLFQWNAAGFATTKIMGGKIDIASCVRAPFGTSFEPDLSGFTPLDDWSFDSL
jgi:hypothetical protein